MKQLIVNADDFGYACGVNDGIVRAHCEGIVTSTTLMATAAEFDQAAELARATPTLDVGCHLVLVSGRPISRPDEIPSLAGETGAFPRTMTEFATRLLGGRIRETDLRIEIGAQLQKIRNAGIEISHIDSHKHTHAFPLVSRVAMEAAAEFGIRWIRNPVENYHGFWPAFRALESNHRTFVRQAFDGILCRVLAGNFQRLRRQFGLRTPDFFYSIALTGLLNARVLTIVIRKLREGVSELMCHPALLDQTLVASPTRLKQERVEEFKAVTNEEVRRAISRADIALTGYRALAAECQ